MGMCKVNMMAVVSLSLLIFFAMATAEDLPLSPSLRRVARALAGNGGAARPVMTCDRYPRVCRAEGSAGPDCCGKRCVNTMTDGNNCGWCGMRCWYGAICCRGRCVGILYDPENCGGCGKRCKRGSYCRQGMCNYGF